MKLNGWMRLWILLTLIWVIIVGALSIAIIGWPTEPSRHEVINLLSDQSQTFYKELEADEEGPSIVVEYSYKDGTKQRVQFPNLGEDALDNIKKNIQEKAIEEGKEVTSVEINQFIELVSIANEKAKTALKEYQQAYKDRAKYLISERYVEYVIAALVLIIPPLIILMLGYGIVWVRKGFKD